MALTPMMQQYLQVKEKCKECILFFRLGDFYEMFFEDAETASRELELVLTGRDCGLNERAPMCGIPFHAANSYIGRLVSKGYKIAICEQMEDPALAKGIVKRDIIKIITPGTYTDSSFLEESKNNFIMSLFMDNDLMNIGMSFCDVSTGEFDCTYSEFNSLLEVTSVMDEISKFMPKELLVEETLSESVISKIKERFTLSITKVPKEYFSQDSYVLLENQFCNFNKDNYNDVVLKCSGALLKYVIETQKVSLSHINEFNYYNILDYLSIDINSRRNLELTETLRDKSKRGSLLWVLDKTSTAMGARQLRSWVEQPLLNKEVIGKRHNALENLLNDFGLIEDIKGALKSIYDIERIVGKISSKSVNAKELISLRNSAEKIPDIKKVLQNSKAPLLKEMYYEIDELKDIYDLLSNSLLDGPAVSIKEGNIIKDGYNTEVDELRSAKAHGKEWIAALENKEREITGIKSLKVGYNKVFGYFIEITKANFDSIPEGRYIRKQTLANAERYITPELKEMEEKILGAEERLTNLEYEIFVSIRDNIEKEIDRMKKTSTIIAQLDCLVSLSLVALENNYCKPTMTEDAELVIEDGRHPVVEQNIPKGSFVSNDTKIDTLNEQLLLITGPNMAGKSTYMRQVALIIIMAQIGSYVPAKSAKISICDKIFTRIGASDDLAGGKSTFMVEMWEVSNILKNASNRSLILLDEVGRGTSTYDGLSIAWSVIEYICENSKLKCKTLFATHYHELTKLEGMINGVKNYSVSVKELENEIVFLRKIIRGGADQSYGIEVAKLAGLPEKVIERAKEILLNIEENDGKKLSKSVENTLANEVALTDETVFSKDEKVDKTEKKDMIHEGKGKKKNIKDVENIQLDFSDIQKDALIKEIASIDILSMNPMDGFNKLYSIVNKAKNL